jgi:ribose/xylose/arabinose/galactoside ABC-type transport system permease subunit
MGSQNGIAVIVTRLGKIIVSNNTLLLYYGITQMGMESLNGDGLTQWDVNLHRDGVKRFFTYTVVPYVSF